MKGMTIEHHHGNLVRRTISSKSYDVIFNLRRRSESITKNKFRLSLNKHNVLIASYFSLREQSKSHIYNIFNRCRYRHMSIFEYSGSRYDNFILQELRMAKSYFDKNYRRVF